MNGNESKQYPIDTAWEESRVIKVNTETESVRETILKTVKDFAKYNDSQLKSLLNDIQQRIDSGERNAEKNYAWVNLVVNKMLEYPDTQTRLDFVNELNQNPDHSFFLAFLSADIDKMQARSIEEYRYNLDLQAAKDTLAELIGEKDFYKIMATITKKALEVKEMSLPAAFQGAFMDVIALILIQSDRRDEFTPETYGALMKCIIAGNELGALSKEQQAKK